jgi:hypothetical protein
MGRATLTNAAACSAHRRAHRLLGCASPTFNVAACSAALADFQALTALLGAATSRKLDVTAGPGG